LDIIEDDKRVTRITGPGHKEGYSFDDVNTIWFWQGNVNYIPSGVGKIFKNLKSFNLGYDTFSLHLKALKRSNFADMKKLEEVRINKGDIVTIERDTFYDLPNVKWITVLHNNIKELSKDLFVKNSRLEYAFFDYNELTFLHKDLFSQQNNPALLEVSFQFNKLTSIKPDFAPYSEQMRNINLHGNTCINDQFGGTSNTTFNQIISLMKTNC